MLLLSLSVTCQARPWTRHLIVKLEQNADFPNQNFYIKPGRHTLSGKPSDINDKNGPAEPGLRVPLPLIESLSWRWLYATNLRVAYELILTTGDNSPGSNSYSWLPAEAVLASVWLLKSYWNPNSSLLNPIEKGAALILTQQDHPFAIITMMFGSTNDQRQCLPSASPNQQAPQAHPHSEGSFTSPLNNDYGGGNGGSQQHSHTLDLYCFVNPCHGVCQFRPGSRGPNEWSLDCEKNSSIGRVADMTDAAGSSNDDWAKFRSLPFSIGDFEVINGTLDSQCLLKLDEIFSRFNHSETQPATTESYQSEQSLDHLSETGSIQPKAVREQTCHLTVVWENGQQQPCGTVCKNALALSYHRNKDHSGQKTCDLTVVTEDGQPRSCGVDCKNIRALSFHKARYHNRQRICDVTRVAEDGRLRPCGKAYKNSKALSDHKRKYHIGQQTCDITSIGEDGQPRPCKTVCKNPQALADHKRTKHSGQKTCDLTVVDKDGQQRACGLACKNAKSLSDHRRRKHRMQPACRVIVVGEDGQQRQCGNLYRDARALSEHKRLHRKRKPLEADQD
ncbi:hypothetical protein [Endozoicomonas sp. 8E]|uniref:hypothetical protein n=1 Tax=Endozoicomonas sp. 8E TaxID=3035692 RepID=UPI0029390EFB|nr:hypothetical protein [Endozoicomonas sp. 8E]WOG26960.1 hypothetical protein P6910_20780 [Endozoicomonas sp. 8E]